MGAGILKFEALNSMDNRVLGFVRPLFNGIRIVKIEDLTIVYEPPFYGDTVDMGFWTFVNIPIGTKNPLVTYKTLQPGYRYIYNHVFHSMRTYDENGLIIDDIQEVNSIADMGIDFTIFQSHQFEILLAGNATETPFLIPAISQKTVSPVDFVEPIRGVNNISYNLEYSYPTQLMNMYDKEFYDLYLFLYAEAYITPDMIPLLCDGYNFDKPLANTNKVYCDGVIYSQALSKWEEQRAKELLGWDYLFSEYSRSLYPIFMPSENPMFPNNMAVYEPWMLTRLYVEAFQKAGVRIEPGPFNPWPPGPDNPWPPDDPGTDDPPGFGPGTTRDKENKLTYPVFDLSPNWGY